MKFLETVLSEETFKELSEKLGEDLIKQVNEKAGDFQLDMGKEKFIPKAKFDEARNSAKEYEKLLADRDKQLTELGTKVKGNTELELQLKTLKEENEKAINDYKDQLTKTKQTYAFESELKNLASKYKPKDLADLKRFLDNDKISYADEDGNYKVNGLSDQLEVLSKEKSYLFESAEAGTGSPANNPNTGSQAGGQEVKTGKII